MEVYYDNVKYDKKVMWKKAYKNLRREAVSFEEMISIECGV